MSEWGANFGKRRDQITEDVGKRIEHNARDLAPSDSGELRASIVTRLEKRGRSSKLEHRMPGKYAPIEFGSRRGHTAQRFMARSFAKGLDDLERGLLDGIESDLLGGR